MKSLQFACLLSVCAMTAVGAATNRVAAVDGASTNGVAAGKASAKGVRNPFWPIGYEGEREVISSGKRKKKAAPAPKAGSQSQTGLSAAEKAAQATAEKAAKDAAAKAAAEKAAKEAAEKAAKEAAARAEAERKKRENTPAHWVAARKSLSFGSRMTFRDKEGRERTSIVINGKDYTDGDLVEIIHDSRRFTWRYEGLSNQNKLSLKPIKAEYLETPGKTGKKSDKGANP